MGSRSRGYVDGVLVIVGTEVSTVTGHLLGFGVPTPTFRFSGDAGDALQDVHDLGGAAFVAHPTSPRPDFRWENWDLPGAWGIELLNGDTQWRGASWARAAWTTLLYPLNASYALLQLITPPTAMDRWNALLAERDVPAIAGSDAHSYIGLMEAVGLRFPSYRSVFELARNHVVLPRPLTGDDQTLMGGRSSPRWRMVAPTSPWTPLHRPPGSSLSPPTVRDSGRWVTPCRRRRHSVCGRAARCR